MNFARKEWRWYAFILRYKKWILFAFVIALVVTAYLALSLWQLYGEKNALENAYIDFYEREQVENLMAEQKDFYKAQTEIKEKYGQKMKNHGDFFYAIVTVPKGMEIKDIEFTKSHMYIAGYTPSEAVLHQYIRLLERYHKDIRCAQKLHKEGKNGNFAFEIRGYKTEMQPILESGDADH